MALIYCVEDDDGIRELISCALKSGGYEVKAFPKAKPFYEEIRNKEPSLVLLDIMLPDEDGYSILSKLKKDSHTQDVPVIMLTAKSSELDKVSGLEMGADDYITKPFGVMELLSRIKAVLRRAGKQNAERHRQKEAGRAAQTELHADHAAEQAAQNTEWQTVVHADTTFDGWNHGQYQYHIHKNSGYRLRQK